MSSDDNRPGRATAPYFIKEFGELGLRQQEKVLLKAHPPSTA